MYEISSQPDHNAGGSHAQSHESPGKNVLKPHGCPRCSKSFSSVHQLAQHSRVHTGEKPYKCPYCDRRFKQQSHVKQHSRLHTGERPYKCSEPSCGRSFVQLSNLQQHMSNHCRDPAAAKTRELNHHCQICGKSFATESSLSLHQTRKHQELNGEDSNTMRNLKAKKYICRTCSKSYTTESALQIHSSKHKAEPESKGIACPLCSETFISAQGLEEHQKVAHPLDMSRFPVQHHHPPPVPYCSPHPAFAAVPWFDPHSLAYPSPLPPPFSKKSASDV